MKLSKDFFTDSKSGKHIPQGNLKNTLKKIVSEQMNSSLTDVFIIDSDMDSRWFSKFDSQVSDWEKRGTNIWVSSFTKSIKFYNVLDKTTYLIYKMV